MSKSIEQHTLRTSRSLLRGLLVLALASVASVAGLGGGTLVGSQTASAAPPQTDKDKAREFFLEGDALFKKELYSAAIENFKKANELYPHPINLYNIARGYEKLGDADNCIKVYNDYLDFHRRQNNGKDPSDLVDVKASIAKCQLLQKPEVTIDSDPYGAAIYLDDKTKLVGQTPITLKLDPGKYKLYLNLDGYVPFEQDLQVSTGQPMTLKFKLEKFQRVGKVRVKSNVRGATVFVDGRNVGLTPYSDTITLEEGAHQIAVSKDEYVPFNREVKVTVNQTEEIVAQIFLRDAPATWKGYIGWTSIILGVGSGVGGYFAGAGILLVILEATDTQLIKGDDELDPMANAPRSPSVKPFVSAGGLVGADVRF